MQQLLIAVALILFSSCAPKARHQSKKLTKSFVMNGTEVKTGEKIAASIVGVYDVKNQSICTGSLIAENIVMTAAHCAPKRASHIKIVFSNNVDDIMNTREQDMYREFVLTATDFKVSPTWDPEDETTEFDTGDIALIKFKGNLPAGYLPAKFLEDQNALQKGAMVTVAGFGVNLVDAKTIDPRKYHNLEQAIEFGEVLCEEDERGKRGTCYTIDTYGDGILRVAEAPIESLQATEVTLDEKKAGTCNGDSGGPAYIKQNGELYLFGVTSRGSALCNETGVYTNALTYRDWIAETIKILK